MGDVKTRGPKDADALAHRPSGTFAQPPITYLADAQGSMAAGSLRAAEDD